MGIYIGVLNIYQLMQYCVCLHVSLIINIYDGMWFYFLFLYVLVMMLIQVLHDNLIYHVRVLYVVDEIYVFVLLCVVHNCLSLYILF